MATFRNLALSATTTACDPHPKSASSATRVMRSNYFPPPQAAPEYENRVLPPLPKHFEAYPYAHGSDGSDTVSWHPSPSPSPSPGPLFSPPSSLPSTSIKSSSDVVPNAKLLLNKKAIPMSKAMVRPPPLSMSMVRSQMTQDEPEIHSPKPRYPGHKLLAQLRTTEVENEANMSDNEDGDAVSPLMSPWSAQNPFIYHNVSPLTPEERGTQGAISGPSDCLNASSGHRYGGIDKGRAFSAQWEDITPITPHRGSFTALASTPEVVSPGSRKASLNLNEPGVINGTFLSSETPPPLKPHTSLETEPSAHQSILKPFFAFRRGSHPEGKSPQNPSTSRQYHARTNSHNYSTPHPPGQPGGVPAQPRSSPSLVTFDTIISGQSLTRTKTAEPISKFKKKVPKRLRLRSTDSHEPEEYIKTPYPWSGTGPGPEDQQNRKHSVASGTSGDQNPISPRTAEPKIKSPKRLSKRMSWLSVGSSDRNRARDPPSPPRDTAQDAKTSSGSNESQRKSSHGIGGLGSKLVSKMTHKGGDVMAMIGGVGSGESERDRRAQELKKTIVHRGLQGNEIMG